MNEMAYVTMMLFALFAISAVAFVGTRGSSNLNARKRFAWAFWLNMAAAVLGLFYLVPGAPERNELAGSLASLGFLAAIFGLVSLLFGFANWVSGAGASVKADDPHPHEPPIVQIPPTGGRGESKNPYSVN
jgi:hypothetical protein